MKTTKKQFNSFRKELKRLLKLYGLCSWDVHYEHDRIDGRAISTTVPELASHIVVFTLNKHFIGDDITQEEFDDIALHEVLELLFTKLEDMVCTCKKDEAREEVHTIIQTIINVNRS